MPAVCRDFLKLISEDDPHTVSLARMPTIMGHFPAGTSLMNLQHWMQMLERPVFQKYDFGEALNLQHYGSRQPPRYDLARIQEAVHLFVGEQDRLADVADANQLFEELKGAQGKSMRLLRLGHAGLVWGRDMAWFEEVAALLQQ